MATEVKWIKLDVSIPDNKKVKRIRKLPDGNNIILFWVFLLARAGESNQKGGLFFTENVPYTEEDLAADFDFSTEFVRFAIMTLEKYRMIELYDDIIFIKNWDEYQQLDKLEKIKEQNRLRQAKYKEKQKLIANSNSEVTLPVTQGNATDIDIDIDIELDKEIDQTSNQVHPKEEKTSSAKLTEDFEKLWNLYPNKQGKKKAFTAYQRAIKSGATNKQVQNGIVAYKKHLAANDWLKPAHGSTWFTNERWNDEYDTKAERPGKPYIDVADFRKEVYGSD